MSPVVNPGSSEWLSLVDEVDAVLAELGEQRQSRLKAEESAFRQFVLLTARVVASRLGYTIGSIQRLIEDVRSNVRRGYRSGYERGRYGS